jgi:aspartyl-tRNA(Asn)/glutamyl-tRNA(Gln) amidotransferase subunit A
MPELWGLSASSLREAYRNGQASPREVVESVLKRIESTDSHVGSITHVDAERALKKAADLEGSRRAGHLHGIPIVVKELFEVEGLPWTAGSQVRQGIVGRTDGPIVAALRDAGGIIVGTTRTHEFAWGITTQHETLGGTCNPWSPDRVPGGSSGGSAAAVAMGAAPLAIGSDTGGSVRIPAAFCGVVGFKPSYDLLSRDGLIPLSRSLDHVGILAREVGDISLLLSALGGFSPHMDELRQLRVLVAARWGLQQPSASYRQAFDAVGDACADMGWILEPVELPSVEQTMKTFALIQLFESHDLHSRVLGTWPASRDEYGSDVRARLERASTVTRAEYRVAMSDLGVFREQATQILSRGDVWLAPVSAGGPSKISDPDRVSHRGSQVAFRDLVLPTTVTQNLLGLPSCAVPAGEDETGVPIGVQVVGRAGADPLVLHVAGELREKFRNVVPAFPRVVV